MATLDAGLATPVGWRAWWLAARPRTLPLAAAPVAVGTALAAADGALRAGPALAALTGALLLQVGANFANDVFDAERGTDGDDRIGPPRAVQMGWISARRMRAGTAAAFAAACLAGVYLAGVGGWPVLIVGALSIAAGLAYTGGPYPLGYHGFGELTVFVFFGLVAVAGTYYVQTLALPLRVLAAAIPVGALASAVLVVNNVRDLEGDRRAGKRTLAVRFGRRAGIFEYATLHAVAQAAPVLLWLSGAAGAPVLATLVTLPWAWRGCVALHRRRDGPGLNALLASTAQLALAHSSLLAAGLAW